jgi:hypothetical protein
LRRQEYECAYDDGIQDDTGEQTLLIIKEEAGHKEIYNVLVAQFVIEVARGDQRSIGDVEHIDKEIAQMPDIAFAICRKCDSDHHHPKGSLGDIDRLVVKLICTHHPKQETGQRGSEHNDADYGILARDEVVKDAFE